MVNIYDAVVEAQYNICAEQTWTPGLLFFAENDIRISEAPTCCGLFKYNPNCEDEIPLTKRAYGICKIGDWIYYSTDVKCNFNAGSSLRKIHKDGVLDQCVTNTDAKARGITYTNKIYGVIYGQGLCYAPTLPSTNWVLFDDLSDICTNLLFRGLTSLENGNFLILGCSPLRIHLFTKDKEYQMAWNIPECTTTSADIAWDGNYCWLACSTPKKLYKLSLPNLPVAPRKNWYRIGASMRKI